MAGANTNHVVVVDAAGHPVPLTVDQNIAALSLQTSQQQASIAARSADIADLALDLSVAQLLLTAAATAYLLISHRQARAALAQGQAALDQAQRHLQIQMRPYVHPIQPEIKVLEVGRKIEIAYTVTNTGQSPSLETQAFANVRVGHIEDDINLHLPGETVSRWVLGANGGHRVATASSAEPLKPDEMAALREKRAWVLLNGTIAYADAFLEPHLTCFAFRSHDRTESAPAEMHARAWANRIDPVEQLELWRQELAKPSRKRARNDLKLPGSGPAGQ